MKTPSLTVDAVILCEDDSIAGRTHSMARKISDFERFSVVLIKRKYDPYKGSWALPGGFVEWGETVESAVVREVKEETGLEVDIIKLVGVYSDPKRDPRGHTVTVCYLTRKVKGNLKADTDASIAQYFKKDEILKLKLAFDHDIILKDAFKLLNDVET
ncbi:NUDIX domain-containing protein [Methanobacterium sp.]|uniref:NUDIX domain-containing protein n=1 Tax=Methanobacterium sp. TaxID=2164 RepID=UPI003C754FCD